MGVMKKPGRKLGAALAVLSLAVAGGTSLSATEQAASAALDVSKLSKDEIETLVYERQQLMAQIDKDAELLGEIVAGIEPASKLKETAAALARDARASHEAFSMKVPGGRTKPEAWSNWADFSKRLDAFVAGADKVAKLGETGSVPAVTDVLGEALQCKSCHDLYREPKKPGA